MRHKPHTHWLVGTELCRTIMVMRLNTLKLRKKSPLGSKRGMFISITFHLILVLISTLWVMSSISPGIKAKSNSRSTAAIGGGGKGTERSIAHKTTAKSKLPKNLAKITSKTVHAELTLPELPDLSRTALGAIKSSSKVFAPGGGGGTVAGHGFGKAIGAVNSRGLVVSKGMNVGRQVLGMNIRGENIAVYLDTSGSMTSSLDSVKKQIEKQFPKADIFTGNGIYTFLRDGVFAGESLPGLRVKFSDKPPKEKPGGFYKLLNFVQLRDLHQKRKYDGNVGGWVDIMLKHSNYDALVIFSDFQDPIAQYMGTKRTFYSYSSRGNVVDERSNDEKAWEERWLTKFALANSGQAPRLYLMSIEHVPQSIYLQCVEASNGEFKLIQKSDLKKRT